jgi:hypothetical protein
MKIKPTKIRLAIMLLCLFILSLSLSNYAKAADRYISPTGNDVTGTGTLASPWKTVDKASTGMSPGDVLYARGGTYTGQAGYIWHSSGTSGNPVTLKNYANETPVFDGGWGANGLQGNFLNFTNLSWIVVDGITMQHFDDQYGNGTIDIFNANGAVSNITIQNCRFIDNGKQSPTDHHIYIGAGATSVTIRNNWFYRTPGGAIHNYHTPYASGIKIYNNVIIGGTSTNYTGNQTWGIIIGDGRNVEIFNNTIYNVQRGIDFDWGQPASVNGTPNAYTVRNNILSNCSTWGIHVSLANTTDHPNYSPYYTSDYNLFYSNGNDVGWGGTNYTLANFKALSLTHDDNSISGNPLFVTAGSDFHLQSTSPAINAGTTGTNIPTVDYEYSLRSGAPDIGAYEYGGSSCAYTYAPNAPTSPTATAVSSSQINLSWVDQSGVDEEYAIERATSSTGPFTEIATVPAIAGIGSTGTYNNTSGLSASTTYYYRIHARNCFGEGGLSTVVNATTQSACSAPSVPNPPLNTTATPYSNSRVDLTWTDNSGIEDNWLVERATNQGGPFTQIASLAANSTSYSNSTGLSASTTYYYRVRAVNCMGYSTYSAALQATTAPTCSAPTVPTSPITPTATANSSSQITFGWYDNSGVEGAYIIERSTSSTAGFTQIASVGPNAGAPYTLSYADWGLNASTTYYYRVRAINCVGPSTAYTTVVSATTSTCSNPTAPTAPISPSATANSSSQITVAWSDNSGQESAYEIERSTNSTTGFVLVGRTNLNVGPPYTMSFADKGLPASTTYYYRVRAVNCIGATTYTTVVSATTSSAGGSSPLTDTRGITLTGNGTDAVSTVTVYPNPFGSMFNVKISDSVVLNNATLKIVDWFGKEVKSVSLSSNTTAVDRDKLQSGIYFYVVTNNGQTIDKGRLMVQ